ncbi:MAG: S8 family serine peptidase [Mariprofundaceae bacterium]
MSIFNAEIEKIRGELNSYKKTALLTGLLLLLLSNQAIAAPAGAAVPQGDYIASELLVKFKSSSALKARNRVSTKVRARVKRRMKSLNIEHWQLPSSLSVQQAIKLLQEDRQIEFAEPNYRRRFYAMPNDPGFDQQWGLNNNGQTLNDITGVVGADMALPAAWNINTGSKNVVIAILDDSVDINHPDLKDNIWINRGEIANNGLDDDGNGYIDDTHGWDFVNNDNDPSADPGMDEGHGTMVAGSAGAVGNNNLGVAGVNWQVSLMAIKMSGDVASELMAMQYAIDNDADIVNVSWGGPSYSQSESGAIQQLKEAGILFVAAAGNYDGNNDQVGDYPSGVDLPNVLAVAGSSSDGTLISWSHYGQTTVDVAAPGENIYVTTSPEDSGSSYSFTDGTSFSSPYVAGIAALIKAEYPNADYQELKGRIMAGVDPLAQARGLLTTDGRANAATSLNTAAAPVLVIRDIRILDGRNNVADPNEQLELHIDLENVWQSATGITATLSSLDANVTVHNDSTTYANIGQGEWETPEPAFNITLGDVDGHQRILFQLDISAAGGYNIRRYFSLELGTLTSGLSVTGSIQQNAQDEFHLYHIDVPAGASQLTIRTQSNTDIDLLTRFDALPQFDFNGYWVHGGTDMFTEQSISDSGDETITISNPKEGVYYAQVINFNQQLASYSIQATIEPASVLVPTSSASGSGGGGCLVLIHQNNNGTLLWMFLIVFIMGLAIKRSTHMSS